MTSEDKELEDLISTSNSFQKQALDTIAENEALKAQVNKMREYLELHIKVLGDLYPSNADDIDGEHIGEFMAVHGLIIETKALLNN